MARYDGLIIPRSYSDYINKTDPATLVQALQQNNVMDAAPTENSNKPAKSGGIYSALAGKQPTLTFDDVPTASSNNPAKSGGIFAANAVIMASGTTLTGVTIASGSIIRVMFTAVITGSDTTTGLSLTYNGTAYPVKVGKQGALADFVATEIDSAYKYVQAYTTLELAFDGSNFIIIGNPVVLSSSDYTIYADGKNSKEIKISDRYTYSDLQSKLVSSSDGYFIRPENLLIPNLGQEKIINIVINDWSGSVSTIDFYNVSTISFGLIFGDTAPAITSLIVKFVYI